MEAKRRERIKKEIQKKAAGATKCLLPCVLVIRGAKDVGLDLTMRKSQVSSAGALFMGWWGRKPKCRSRVENRGNGIFRMLSVIRKRWKRRDE